MTSQTRPGLRRPVFVIGAPQAGADLLAGLLGRSPGTTVLALPGHPLAATPALLPDARGWDTSRLGLQDARPDGVRLIEESWAVAEGTRLVATWPDAALQVRFLRAAWPGARFVFVHRDPLEALTLSLAAWESTDAPRQPGPPEWSGTAWTGPLTPEWRGLSDATLTTVVADQWRRTTELALADLERLPAQAWTAISHQELVAAPDRVLAGILPFLGLEAPAEPVSLDVPAAVTTDRERLEPVLAGVAGAAQRAREALERKPAETTTDTDASFASEATPNFAELLRLIGSSLVVSTYQTGRVVLMREKNGALNTHFRRFPKPMGIAHRPGMLALGTRTEVVTFRNVPGLADRVGDEHDAVFVPRTALQTGDIRIHDIAWAGDELWAVNTRFSCLVTFDGVHSFVPRWRPTFVSALAAEDRCHLNGLAVVDDEVRYVTALGTTDSAGGWRPGKADGGVVIDVRTNEIVSAGLSMPHSPRWYRDRLWVLESGQGTLVTVDPGSGERTTVAQLPGFTRGLSFAGRYAFIGLSQVREATTFGGLPLTARLEDRQCGVWIVDIETGQTMGFVRFEDRVEEIFDVALLPGVKFPELLAPGDEVLVNAFMVPPA